MPAHNVNYRKTIWCFFLSEANDEIMSYVTVERVCTALSHVRFLHKKKIFMIRKIENPIL